MAEVPFRVLTVCTMNICRSPAIAVAIENFANQCPAVPDGAIHVSSVGTHAIAGAPRCGISLAMVGVDDDQGVSTPISGEAIEGADLIVTAERRHLEAVLTLNHRLRDRSFTVRQAGRLSGWVISSGALATGVAKARGVGIEANREQPATFAPALPMEPGARLRWLVSEMNAARGMAPVPASYSGLPHEPDDIPDPHVVGFNVHRMSADFILEATASLAAAATTVLSV
jgi:protein-tyrosine-phosphatase